MLGLKPLKCEMAGIMSKMMHSFSIPKANNQKKRGRWRVGRGN